MIYKESDIQVNCVRWFRLAYPEYHGYLFSVPNGGKRNAMTAAIMKAEGVVAGVADLLLLLPRGGFHGLCIEMKTEKGKQSESQRKWADMIMKADYKYVVCRTAAEFSKVVREYLERPVTVAGMELPKQFQNKVGNFY